MPSCCVKKGFFLSIQEVTFHFLFDSLHVLKPVKSGSTMVYKAFNQPYGARENTLRCETVYGAKTVLDKKKNTHTHTAYFSF